MFVAADDTDSMRGNCTTFLATEIIRDLVFEEGLDLIGFPRLVRLNPAIPWKTRGNGALVMEFGRGTGESFSIGNIGGRVLRCFAAKDLSFEPSAERMAERIRPLVEEFHDPVDSDPGIVISSVRPDPSFYRRGVTRVMPRADVEREIARIGATTIRLGCGRGVIGCVCGMAWEPGDRTYELLSYRPRSRWGTERVYDRDSIERADEEIVTSFNSWEERGRRVAMVPSTPCPVMYGFRGDDWRDLVRGHDIIETEEQSRWVVFETNQGTDDHLIRYPSREQFIPNSSYLVGGTVKSARRISGGHQFLVLDTVYGELECAAYAPSREFRDAISWLMPGDVVEVTGELRQSPRTLNIEKIHVVSTVPAFRKVSNPVCPSCGRTMSSAGRGKGYRCRACGTSAKDPITVPETRWIVPGWYQPPTESRRHLTKPLKRMGLVQPVEFVNGRSRMSTVIYTHRMMGRRLGRHSSWMML